MSYDYLDEYFEATQNLKDAKIEHSKALDTLNTVADFMMDKSGVWNFFVSLDAYRIGYITGRINQIPYDGLRTPNSKYVPVFRAGGMGDYDPGMDLQEHGILYGIWQYAGTIESYRPKVLKEIKEHLEGLSEIAANGIPVKIQLIDYNVEHELKGNNVERITGIVKGDLKNYWAKKALDRHRKTV